MLPLIGLIFLIMAALLSFATLGTLFEVSIEKREAFLKRSVSLQFVMMTLSFCMLMYLCGTSDFSVTYVVAHTHTHLPLLYRLAAAWGGHEGSLLLWLLFLSGWSVAFSRSKLAPLPFKQDVLLVLNLIFLCFSLFVMFTSNPFSRLLPLSPIEGKDLNPLLQDPGLIFHPPLLYLGYVGAALPYAFALAACKHKQWTPALTQALRPWVLAAWAFLTAGITLGSFWAYYELGWGGFWFWDPVENASVMPWFCLTALIHTLIVCEKREMLKRFSLLLSIFAFLFSILGTFLVRSGVIVSVHAFASDPTRGEVILLMLFIFSLVSLLLYTWRVPAIKEIALEKWQAREGWMAIGGLLLFTIAMIVVLGTLYPIVLEMLFREKISVGAPYFNAMIMPLGLVLVGLAAFGPTVNWSRFAAPIKRHAVSVSMAAGIAAALAWYWHQTSFYFLVGSWVAIWLLYMTLIRIVDRLKSGKPFSFPFWGMVVGHVGVAVLALGLSLTTSLSVVREVQFTPGEKIELAGFSFEFKGVRTVEGANFKADEGLFEVKTGNQQFVMLPQKRKYQAGGQVLTETALKGSLHQDILIALGEPLSENAWSVRLQVRPFVRLIWLGGLLMALAGALSAASRRYRV